LQWHGVLPVCLLQATARIYRRFGLKEVIAVVKVWFDCTIELSFSFQAVFHPSSAMPYRI
jgi:fumarate reductase subunit C